MKKLSHYDKKGRASMVDVSAKKDTKRTATAQAFVKIRPAVLKKLPKNPKGDPLEVARFAGIMAAKKTHELIPLCHPLLLTKVAVEIEPDAAVPGLRVTATAEVTGPTGVEMEALTAAAVACLTIYDMAKAVDRGMTVTGIRLLQKSGGASGDWERGGPQAGEV